MIQYNTCKSKSKIHITIHFKMLKYYARKSNIHILIIRKKGIFINKKIIQNLEHKKQTYKFWQIKIVKIIFNIPAPKLTLIFHTV